MRTKVLFYDEDSDLTLGTLTSAGVGVMDGVKGIGIRLLDDIAIFLPNQGIDMMERLFFEDKVDLRLYGNLRVVDLNDDDL